MAGMSMDFSIATPSKAATKIFIVPDKDGNAIPKVKDALMRAIMLEARGDINKEIKNNLQVKSQKTPIHPIVDFNFGHIRELHKQGEGVHNFNKLNQYSKSRQRFDAVAKFFFRVVARTPYDEDYEYTDSRISGKDKSNTGVDGKKMFVYVPSKQRFYIRKHKADEDVAKNDWELEFCGKTFKPSDFPDVDFENAGTNEWEKISHQLQDAIGDTYYGSDNDTFYIENKNKHIDILEFGLYKKGDMGGKSIRKGNARFHGTNGGYSVQAPRGIIRTTLAEFDDSETEHDENGNSLPINKVKILDDSSFNITIPVDANNVLHYALHTIKLLKKDFVEEKDILSYVHNGYGLDVFDYKDLHEGIFNELKQEALKQLYSDIKNEISEAEKELKRKADEERRKQEKLEREAKLALRQQHFFEGGQRANEARRKWTPEQKRRNKNARERERYRKQQESKGLSVRVKTQKQNKQQEILKKKSSEKKSSLYNEEIQELLEKSKKESIFGFFTFEFTSTAGAKERSQFDCMFKEGKIYLASTGSGQGGKDESNYELWSEVLLEEDKPGLIKGLNETFDEML